MVGMTSRELTMKALPVLSVVAGTLAFYSPALAHCGVTDLKLEQAIARKVELRQSANVQVVRDLRTLREAAMILDANQHPAECQRLVAVVRELVADPKRAIETSSDTDEDKAEVLRQGTPPKNRRTQELRPVRNGLSTIGGRFFRQPERQCREPTSIAWPWLIVPTVRQPQFACIQERAMGKDRRGPGQGRSEVPETADGRPARGGGESGA